MSSYATAGMSSIQSGASALKSMVFNKKFIIILFVVTIFIAVAFFVYNQYIAPKMNPDFVPNKEFVKEGEGLADLYFFNAEWCPYSKKARPIWDKLKKEYDGKNINNTVLRLIEVDGEKEDKKMENFESKFLNGKKIDGYPSIYMVKEDQVIEYEAKPKIDTLKEFIDSVL